MLLKKKLESISDLQKLNKFACSTDSDIGVHANGGEIIVEAKSVVGLFCIDFSQPVELVTEDEDVYKILCKMFRSIDED